MGYSMRFVASDANRLDLAGIEKALRQTDAAYAIKERQQSGPVETGTLVFGEEVCAALTLASSGGAFAAEVAELQDRAARSRGAKRTRVLALLGEVKQVLLVEVDWQDRDHDAVLSHLDPLWRWLAANYDGLIHADGEGFYDGCGLVLRTK